MLIKCPECGKEISDKSEQCIHCGYPLSQLTSKIYNNTNICEIDGEKYDFSEVVNLYKSGYPYQAILTLQKIYDKDIDKKINAYLIIYFEENKCFPLKINSVEIETPKKDKDILIQLVIRYQKEEKITKQKSKICPKCGSTEFTPLRKKWSLLAGFATNKIDMVCNNCGTIVKWG